MSENELRNHIEGCKARNRLSQQWIFERYYRMMFGVCLRYTNDTDRVQDMVQEGFLKVFTNIEGYTSKGSFEGWMRRIMVNTAIDAIRKMKVDRMEVTEDEHLELLVGAEEEVEEPGRQFTVQEILDAMEQLSPSYRAVFNLYVFDNYSHQEIAEKLGISVGASKSNFAKAKRNVKSILLGTNEMNVAK
jgi:RNA polymerase sigma-70 factor (ECF subfamily)